MTKIYRRKMMTIYKNDPKYKKIFMSKNLLYYAGWNCQNQQGQQKHKITLFGNSYKVNSKWGKVTL